ncbi:LamG-like jellyroll fold domain-containing protein [Streptomyces sp. NPDC056004]|uniref:LamG-like jellyroll fold domain-containing protein n=1 Tax=Streptomyces sp. NPDC056004 TaxID=3345677 RepID=UPI0035E1A999
MTRVTVEAAFGTSLAQASVTEGTWTDITQYTDVMSAGISITRGAESELSQTQAGTCTLRLNNQDGRFAPGNSGSPYYPNVIDSVPIRINVATVDTNYVRNPSFEGGSLNAWTWSQAEIAPVGSPVQSGTRAVRVTWNTAADAYFTTTVYGLTIGATYTASVYVWVAAGDVAVRLSMGSTLSAASPTVGAYARLVVTFTATASVMPLRVVPASSPAAGNQVYVDAVQVEAGGTAGTFSSTGAQLHPRFWGLVNQWPVQWEGLYSTVTVTATDVFAVLSRAEQQMRPMLVQETLVWTPQAYWPMDEPAESVSAGDESGRVGPLSLDTVQAGSGGGTLAFAGGAAPLGMDGAPLFTPATASTGKYLRGAAGPDFRSGSSTSFLAEAWISTSTAGRTFLALSSTGGDAYVLLSLAAGTGYLTVETKLPDSSAVVTTVGAVSLANGTLHHVIYDSAVQEVYIDGVSIGSFSAIQQVGDLSLVTVGGTHLGGSLWAGSVSNVALYTNPIMNGGLLVSHYTCGTTGFAGETADERALRLSNYLGINYGDRGYFTTGIAHQAALGSTGLDHLREVEATEGGVLTADRDYPAITLLARSTRYNPTAAFSLSYPDLETGDVTLAYDTQKVMNTVLVTRPGGATQRVVHAGSRAVRGPIGRTVDTLATSDLVTTDLGNWLLQRYAEPRPELRNVAVQAFTMGTAMYRTLMTADVGTVATVTSLPSQAPSAAMTVTVEGYTETIRHNDHQISFHTSSTATTSVWVLDDPVYSVLGSTTRLAY